MPRGSSCCVSEFSRRFRGLPSASALSSPSSPSEPFDPASGYRASRRPSSRLWSSPGLGRTPVFPEASCENGSDGSERPNPLLQPEIRATKSNPPRSLLGGPRTARRGSSDGFRSGAGGRGEAKAFPTRPSRRKSRRRGRIVLPASCGAGRHGPQVRSVARRAEAAGRTEEDPRAAGKPAAGDIRLAIRGRGRSWPSGPGEARPSGRRGRGRPSHRALHFVFRAQVPPPSHASTFLASCNSGTWDDSSFRLLSTRCFRSWCPLSRGWYGGSSLLVSDGAVGNSVEPKSTHRPRRILQWLRIAQG